METATLEQRHNHGWKAALAKSVREHIELGETGWRGAITAIKQMGSTPEYIGSGNPH